ncbi:eukaryotic translation initiation factor 3 subunit J-like [Dysidea avara]|uniref:eukaryotic translation initiation factor 3 subunit J-like n=1 Tax=Dysidea avara TaxID=196820 RepID=UPI003321B200
MADDEDFSWDADDFDPDQGFKEKDKESDRWEGEDEGIELPDHKQETSQQDDAQKSAATKKSKVERIEEKKAERRAKEVEKNTGQDAKELTQEEIHTEKMRLLQLQKDADLQVAKELFDMADGSEAKLSTKEDFQAFSEKISKTLKLYETSPFYFQCLEDILLQSCTALDPEDLRKLSTMLSALATEKQKAAKGTTKAKSKKGKTIAVGKSARRMDMDYDEYLGDEFDDFM